MTSQIEIEFDRTMMEIYVRAKKEANYTATIFHRMLSKHRGVETAKRLINDPTVSDGYTALWERGRLDLTVEAVVLDNPRWHQLFTQDEIERARDRLDQYHYFRN